jgi:hypothetical protein
MAIASLVDYESLPTETVVNPARKSGKSDTHLKPGNGEGEKAWEAEQRERDRLNEEGLGGLSVEEALKQALSETGSGEDEEKRGTVLWEKKEKSARKAPESQGEKEKEVSDALTRTMNFVEENTAPKKEAETGENEKRQKKPTRPDAYMNEFYESEREYSGDTNGVSSEEKLRQIIEDYMKHDIPPDGVTEEQLKVLRKMRKKKLDREKQHRRFSEEPRKRKSEEGKAPQRNAHAPIKKSRDRKGYRTSAQREGKNYVHDGWDSLTVRQEKEKRLAMQEAWGDAQDPELLRDTRLLHEPVETIIPATIPGSEDNPAVYSSSQEDQREEDHLYEEYLYGEGNLTPEQQERRDEQQEHMEILGRIQEQKEKKLNYNLPAGKYGDPQKGRHHRSGRRGGFQLATGRGI